MHDSPRQAMTPAPRTDGVDPLIGNVIADRYRVLELVARGGMGMVYRAEQIPLGRTVALKVLAPSASDDSDEPSFRRRFEREASICSRLTHSNTVRVFDYGWTPEGIYFIAMEFIEGRTLQQVIKQEAPLDPARVVHILKQIASSLSEAHKQGIVHRDLKPGNVLLSSQGDDRDFVKVVDFGLVKHAGDKDITEAGLIVGSPMYMSPEQVRGGELDHRTDIYALGMIGYVALTGRRPFDKETPVAVLMARMTTKPPRMKDINPAVDAPPSLEWVVMTMLQMERRDRFDSMYEVVRALRVCDAQIRRDPSVSSFTMTLDNGKTVLPADFVDPSNVRRAPTPVPMGSVDVGPPSGSSRTAAAAGLSVVAILLMALLGLGGALLMALVYIGFTSYSPTPTAVNGTPPEALPIRAPEPVRPPPAPDPVAPTPAAEPPTTPALTPEPATVRVDVAPPVRVAPKPPPQKVHDPDVQAAPPVEPTPPPPPVDPVPAEGWKVKSDIKNPFGNK